MRETRLLFRFYLPWQLDKEAAWLEQKAREGWLLRGYSLIGYEFQRSAPRELVYRTDFHEGREKDLSEYLSCFEGAGWEHICSYGNWQYFCIPREQYKADIYSDVESQIIHLRRVRRVVFFLMFPIFFPYLTLFNPLQISDLYDHLYFWDYFYLGITGLMVLMLILYVIWLIKITQRIHELVDLSK
ncbi:MAG: DUF2812 domain-containing protein [Anaerolineaceae bacterium]|nr:DUF2812 domain-containing protein [Anaerolineaceae bacterium]